MRRSAMTSAVARAGLPALALLCALASQGCNYGIAALYLVEGPPKIQAAYDELNPERKTIVFIDDRGNSAPRRALRRAIGQAAEEALLAEGVLKPEMVIPSSGALFATAQEKRSDARSIVEIGRSLGAEVVIYVNIHQFTLSRDGASLQPAASGFVKVIDAAADQRIWPDGSAAGHPVSYTESDASAEVPKTSGERTAAEDRLAKFFGREIARVFFDHKKDYASDKRAAN